jgi:hypothetical protein
MSNFDLLDQYLSSLVECYKYYKLLKKALWNYESEKKDIYGGQHAIKVQSLMLDRIFPLDSALQNQMEEAFGFDFKQVRLHTGTKAETITGKAGARAVTIGTDIYFASGAFDPYRDEGLKLLAHELVHVKQFSGGKSPSTGEDREYLEGEAYRAEKVIGENFHNLELGALENNGSDAFSQQGMGGSLNKEAGGEGPDLLDDFAFENREQDKEVVMQKSGRLYCLSGKEVEEAKKEALKAFKEDLDERFDFANGEDKIRLIEKLKAGGYTL